MEVVKKRSKLWYIVPLVFSVVGGIILYFILRNSDKKLAGNCFKIGVLNFVLQFVISIAIQMFITGPINTG